MHKNSSQNLKIFKSSAGSGKTYTLAKEYLKLIFANKSISASSRQEDYFKHILAITFTNDAANEMKERVLKYLQEFSMSKENDANNLLEEIIEELKVEYPKGNFVKADLIIRSGNLIRSILHNYSDFNIQTIDSFTNLIGRSFSRELGLPGDYEIYLDTKEKIDQAVDLMLDGIGDSSKELNEWLFQFVEEQIEDDKSWNVSFKLKEFAHEIEKETKFEQLEKLKDKDLKQFKDAKIILTKELKKLESTVKEYCRNAIIILDSYGLDHQDLIQKSRGLKSFLVKNLEVPFSVSENKGLSEGIKNDFNWLHKDYRGADSIVINEALKIILLPLQDYILENKPIHSIYINVSKNLYQLALLTQIKEVLTELKLEDEQVFLSDLNIKIRDVVMNEPVPFIYEKAGVKYKHILIDEFQDTSGFQWINLIPLIKNSLSQSNRNLIVGDAKQAIYAFRGGKPEILVDLASENADDSGFSNDFINDAWVGDLQDNWRSAPEIVDFNNQLFEWIRENNSENYFKGLNGFYDNVKQEAKKNYDSEIRIDVIQNDGSYRKDDLNQIKCEFVLEYINYCKGLDYTERDIAILSRRNEESKLISKFLIDNEIQVLSDESLLLESSEIIQLLINVIYFLKEPLNQEFRFAILNALVNHLKIKDLDWNAVEKEIKKKPLEGYIKYLLFLSKKEYDERALLVGSLYQIVLSWIKCFALDSDLNQQVFIDHFLDILSDPNSKNNKNANLFTAYWEEKHEKISISSSDEQNAVRIVSIHRSKGLEYPIVILPFPEWNIDRAGKIWTEWDNGNPTDLEIAVINENQALKGSVFEDIYNSTKKHRFIEELNLLYVAMTRATKGLYILSSNSKGNTFAKVINEFLESNSIPYLDKLFKDEIEYQNYLIKEFEGKSEEGISSESIFEDFSVSNRLPLGRNLKWNQDYSFTEEQLIQIEKGRSFHVLLSLLNDKRDREQIIEYSEDVLKFDALKISFRSFLDNLLEDDSCAFLYTDDWDVYLEKDLVYENALLRPDRLQLKDNEIAIIDYKTGHEDPKHLSQIQSYGYAAQAIFGKDKMSLYLIYMEPFKVIKVS